MYDKRIRNAFLGEGVVSLIYFFSTDKSLGTRYDIHLLCAMIADHGTVLAIFFS